MTRTSEFRSDVRTSRVNETFVFGAEPSRRLPVVHFGQSKARGLVKFQASVSKLRSPVTPASAHTIFVPGTPPPIVVCTHVYVVSAVRVFVLLRAMTSLVSSFDTTSMPSWCHRLNSAVCSQ